MSYPPNPTLTIHQLLGRPRADLSRWLPDGNVHWLAMGRQAILAALQALRVPAGSTVLLPAYQCPSALDPFIAYGVKPVFYDLTPSLEPDVADLSKQMQSTSPALLMVIHYYGFALPQFAEVRSLARAREITLLEDCAHALFSKFEGEMVGGVGCASVFSLAKSLPVPSGGVLVLRDDGGALPTMDRTPATSEWLCLLKLLLYRTEQYSPVSVRTVLRSFRAVDRGVRRRTETPADGLELCQPRAISKRALRIIERCDPDPIVQRRRENYLAVLEVIIASETGIVRPMLPSLPEGVCPLCFPVLVPSRRDDILMHLWRRGSPVRAMWDRLPSQVECDRFLGAAHIRDHILTLPVHQSLHPRQVRRIAISVLQATGQILRVGDL